MQLVETNGKRGIEDKEGTNRGSFDPLFYMKKKLKKLKDYIHVEKNAISHEFCDEILKEYKKDEYVEGTINDNERSRHRKCDVVYISNYDTIEKSFQKRRSIDNRIYKIIHDKIDRYLDIYAPMWFNMKGDTGYQLIKYKTGDFVTEHIDTSGGESRILSCSLLLNDDYKGGELAFFNKRYKHKGSKGDLVIFPSSFTYPHEVLPVKSGTRYSIVTWIR